MKKTNPIQASLLIVAIAMSTSVLADSNFYMTGTYKVTLSEGSKFLSCRAKPSTRAPELQKLYKGDRIEVTDVMGASSPWLKTEFGCYVRGHANYLMKVGLPKPE